MGPLGVLFYRFTGHICESEMMSLGSSVELYNRFATIFALIEMGRAASLGLLKAADRRQAVDLKLLMPFTLTWQLTAFVGVAMPAEARCEVFLLM